MRVVSFFTFRLLQGGRRDPLPVIARSASDEAISRFGIGFAISKPGIATSAKKLGGLAMTVLLVIVPTLLAMAEDVVKQESVGKLVKVEAEIVEVEELKEPLGAAIYTVKDLSSGATLRIFADPLQTLVQTGGKSIRAADVLWGSKATIVYRDEAGKDLPQAVYVKITTSYYG